MRWRSLTGMGLLVLVIAVASACASSGHGGDGAMSEAMRSGRLGDVNKADPTFPHGGYAPEPVDRYRQWSDVFDGPGGFGVGR